jgi:nicotinamide riboside transporter PnuC
VTWALAALSLLGVWLNIRKDRRCFALWVGTNATWAVVDLRAGLPAQALLMSVYAAMAVWGWLAWSRTTKPAG